MKNLSLFEKILVGLITFAMFYILPFDVEFKCLCLAICIVPTFIIAVILGAPFAIIYGLIWLCINKWFWVKKMSPAIKTFVVSEKNLVGLITFAIFYILPFDVEFKCLCLAICIIPTFIIAAILAAPFAIIYGLIWLCINKWFWMQKVTPAIITFVISFIFFLQDNRWENVSIKAYIVICSGLSLLCFSLYKIRKNEYLYIIVSQVVIANSLVLFGLKLYKKILSSQLFSLYLVIVGSIIACIFYLKKRKNNQRTDDAKQLQNKFTKRDLDFDRIKNYLFNEELKENRIGIVGEWGSGKTFLLNMLRTDDSVAREYNIIIIESLSLNVEKIQSYIVLEIKKILQESGVYSKASSNLYDILTKDYWYSSILRFFFPRTESYTESLNELKQDLQKLDKKILLVVEDIDRLNEQKDVRLFFDIVEKLTSETKLLKALFLYSETNLEKIDKTFNHDFVEKYIPYQVKLSELSLESIIRTLISKNDKLKNKLKSSDFYFLFREEINSGLSFNFNSLKIKNIFEKIHITWSIRRVEIFLTELAACELLDKFEKNRETIVTVFFLKHFCHNIYTKIDILRPLVNQFMIKYDEKEFTIYELIDYQKQNPKETKILSILDDERNAINLWILHCFEINISVEEEKNDKGNLISILTEKIRNIQIKNYNEKIERLVKNIINSGVTVDTDNKQCVDLLKSMVLDMPKEKRIEAFEKYDKYLQDLMENNPDFHSVIHHIGISRWVDLFKAFRSVEMTDGLLIRKGDEHHSSDYWMALIDLFFESTQNKVINEEVLEVLHYCNLGNKDVFLHAIKRFCTLDIEVNFNREKCFGVFLDDYFSAIGSLGFATIRSSFLVADFRGTGDVNALLSHSIEPTIESIGEYNKTNSLPSVNAERTLVVEFLNKIKELMQKEKPSKPTGRPNVNVNVSSHYIHQDEIDRIKKLNLPYEKLLKEVDDSYRNGKIYAIEADVILSESQSKEIKREKE